jgi:K+-sensing histidine kinase KdpD
MLEDNTSAYVSSLQEKYLSFVFHELRTPLTVLHSYAQLIQSRLPDDPALAAVRRFSDNIVLKSDEIVEMLEELLEAQRIGEKRLNLDLIQYDLQALLRDSIEHLPEDLRANLNWIPSAAEYPVVVEGGRIMRALRNVLEYAGQLGRPLSIYLENIVDSNICFKIVCAENKLTAEQAQTLFERFHPALREASEDEVPKAGILDISMYIARGLIEAHNGTLEYNPALPGFELRLPLESR